MVWHDETIRNLRDLWAQGLSTAEIGRRLGVSKNAIVGKAHRLDLDARPSPIRRDGPKPVIERVAPNPRMAGPTLPPLASAAPAPAIQPASNVQSLRPAPAVVPELGAAKGTRRDAHSAGCANPAGSDTPLHALVLLADR